ncbi:MAG: hypothetical protein IJ075_03785 [Lachnospiraceae bacterium]|nr:hypothetical protein [Lachnospiraceae bacterium]
MADISISPVNTNISPAPAASNTRSANAAGANRTAGAKAADQAREAAEALRERSAEIRREQLEDVISVSEDGDTVQATDQSRQKLAEEAFGHMEIRQDQTETGEVTEEAIAESAVIAIEGSETQQAIAESTQDRLVNGSRTEEIIGESVERTLNGTSRTDQAIEAGNERAEQEEAEEEYNEKLASYNGISDMKLEQMYLQGEISKIDYDQEMESREERREAENEDNARFGNEMTGAAVLEESGERDLQQIETAFSGEANDTISTEDRMEIIESLDARTLNAQADANVISDANASGEETIKKVVFS